MNKVVVSVLVVLPIAVAGAFSQQPGSPPDPQRALVSQYCAGCHNDRMKAGGFSWTGVDVTQPERHAELMEQAIRKVRAGMMPPAGSRRPDEATLRTFADRIAERIDQTASAQPHVKPPALHRLNRTEFRNAVRDLLSIEVDVTTLLPADPRVGTFDNMADALTVTPALMQGYLRAAEKVSRDAVGDPKASPAMVGYSDVEQVGKAANQYRRVEGAPFGTRGGMSVIHNFPADGDYTFKAALVYHPQGQLVGARLPDSIKDQQLEVSIDGVRAHLFTIDPEAQEYNGDLVTPPVKVTAGPHRVSVVFLSRFDGPVEDQYWLIEQLLVDATVSGRPEITALPHLKNFWITGPLKVTGISDTPSRRRIFICQPVSVADERACAERVIANLARQAFRRASTPEDLETLMTQYETGRKTGNFESGVQTALQAILVHPEFLFRFERTPDGVAAGATYRISDVELASRLSFFLWSSAPDDALLSAATSGALSRPGGLEQQVRRMLADPRSDALVKNFAGQWLRLASIVEMTPESLLFPNFTRNLGQSMRREIELLVQSVVREDRNVMDLLTADYTFVDEVLARHYKIPNIVGPRFQRVKLTDPNRYGLIGKAGILLITALPNRTSPVARGKYILEVLMGAPPPLPPPNVPPLKEAGDFEIAQTVRERLEKHREVEPCRACHQIMDPLGLAMENFDPVGLWRTRDHGSPVDPRGVMFDGTPLDGPASVRDALVRRSGPFISNVAEQLYSYGLGRVIDHRDMPAIRTIVRESATQNNKFSTLIIGVVNSPSFRMSRNAESSVAAVAERNPVR